MTAEAGAVVQFDLSELAGEDEPLICGPLRFADLRRSALGRRRKSGLHLPSKVELNNCRKMLQPNLIHEDRRRWRTATLTGRPAEHILARAIHLIKNLLCRLHFLIDKQNFFGIIAAVQNDAMNTTLPR